VLRDEHFAQEDNLTAHARLWLHPDPRPTVLCVHGYLGGRWGFEESAFAVRWLHGLGVDVALALLPFHGARCPNGRQGMWPGRDPWRTVEGFAQAVYDLRALLGWLRARGAPTITLFGMSLGAYTAALVATVCDDVDHAVLMVPLASLADVYIEHREMGGDRVPPWLRPRIDQAFRVVSPLARPARLRGRDVLVLAAGGDGITRRSHAERLVAHFEASLEVFPGGHLLQVGRGRAFTATARFLAERGLPLGEAFRT
jgi:pimeloyl-ACP methyl ester carboxylesterase